MITLVWVLIGVIGGLVLVPAAIAAARRLIDGSYVPEVINDAFVSKYESRAAREGWFHRFLVVFDIFVNVCARGQQDETISSRAWRASLEKKLWGRILNGWLDWWQPQHGPKAAVGDIWRAKIRIQTNQAALVKAVKTR